LKVASVKVPGFRGRVLVVDDEVAIGRVLKRSLSPYHDVTVVTSGTAALECLTRGERFDAILLDVMMPDVSGMETYERLLTFAPEQAGHIVFVTGGAFTARAREFLDRVPNQKLEKPIDSASLLTAIERLAGHWERD
jgi:CheY-like chemotaxis protein